MTATAQRKTTAADLEQAFLECRLYGHAWTVIGKQDARKEVGGVWQFLLCTRCDSERHDLVSVGRGDLISRRYLYAEGYQVKKSEKGSLRAPQLRKEAISRLLKAREVKLYV